MEIENLKKEMKIQEDVIDFFYQLTEDMVECPLLNGEKISGTDYIGNL